MRTLTRADLDACITARLSGFHAQTIQKAAQSIFTLVNVGEGIPLDKNALGLFFDSFGLVPAGNPETLAHALIAMAAEHAEAWHLFYPSAYLVHQAEKQAERARNRRRGDALDVLMREAIDSFPRFGPSMLWAEFCRRASTPQIRDEALSSYDALAETLAFEPRPGAELVDIGYPAFRRRFSRIKKSLGHGPAAVSSGSEHAVHRHDIRRAA